MRTALLATLLLLLLLPASAEDLSQNRIYQVGDNYFPHIVFGGTEWKTMFYFVNTTDEVKKFPVHFYADNGDDMLVPCLDGFASTVLVTMTPMGSIGFETDNPEGVAPGSGWAEFEPEGNGVYGLAIFRQSVPGRNDVEATVPSANLYHTPQHLVFDNSRGFTMGVALANPSPWEDLTVEVRFYDGNGKIFHTEDIRMHSRTHTAFSLPVRFPKTAGKQGSIVFETKNARAGLAILGLRFSPNGAFTSVHPWGKPNLQQP